MKKKFVLFALLALAQPLPAQGLTGEEVLRKIDQNMVVEQALSITQMIVHGRSGSRTIKSKVWRKGDDKAFVEYLSPAREKGKKMLKLGDKLWNYVPEPNDRIITIAGHLLRQSVMGSDLSYEDVTENDKLVECYAAAIEGEEAFSGRNCHVLKLTATKRDVNYYSRRIWVDKERWLPLKEERYAKSGRLLKTFEIVESFKVDNRWYPRKMIFKDMLSRGRGTEYFIETIDFNVKIPDHKFTKASLRK
ncbi:MAG: outer membrane lipoprotein-sorting protein [Deltaproteobacteria bacterium]|nr:outer membrane lipoprotein-sorting protein [Deltaproteobacteria bacterium]